MKGIASLPQFREIDRRLKSIGTLANQDPLFIVVQRRFLREMNHHLTSLKSTNGRRNSRGKNAEQNQLKAHYLTIGKEHAIHQLFLDMKQQPITIDHVMVLAEILFGRARLRDKTTSIIHASGNRQTVPDPEAIPIQLEKLLQRFNKAQKQGKLHPILLASQLHHGITQIHPFKDWNGRIARLLLNVALMNTGCLPILISRSERQKYYESLEAADSGDISALASFIADQQLESIEAFTSSPEYLSLKGKYELEARLGEIGSNKRERCLILTEDSTSNNLLQVLLESSGFKMDETKMISYEGCSKIASANLFSIFVKEKMPNMHILVHRDRDYLTDSEIEKQHETFHRIDVRFFCTEGTDIESYFLNAEHIHHCYPDIKLRTARAVVDDTIIELQSNAIDYLYKKEFGNRKEGSTHLYSALVEHVQQQPFRFTHGKTAKKVLEHKLHDLLRKKPKLEKASPALSVPKLAQIASQIWR